MTVLYISRSSWYYVVWSSPAQHGPCKRPRHSEGGGGVAVTEMPRGYQMVDTGSKITDGFFYYKFLNFPTCQFFLIKTYSLWQIPSKYFTIFPEKRLQVIFRRIISATLIVYAQSSSSYSISLPYLSDIDMFMDWVQCDLYFVFKYSIKWNQRYWNIEHFKTLFEDKSRKYFTEISCYYVIATHIILE